MYPPPTTAMSARTGADSVGVARTLTQVVQPEHRVVRPAQGVVDDGASRDVALEDGLLETCHAANLANVR